MAVALLLAVALAAGFAVGAQAHEGHDHGAEIAQADTGADVQAEDVGALDRVLVFSKTAGFRHDSIPNGIAAIRRLGQENGFAVDATEDAAQFNDANLAQYDAVVFLSTTGDVLNNEQQGAFERYIGGGGGFVGIHAAADTEYTWSWYGGLVGAYFKSHPPGTPTATVEVEDQANPSTSHLPADWVRTDEWYNYQKPVAPSVNGGGADYSPRNSGVHVLATVDENTYDEQDDSAAADDHPIAWCSNYDGGRSWYTGGGHTQASFSEDNFVRHILGGIRWAGGSVDADCGAERQAAPSDSDFEQKTLARGGDILGEPMAMAVLPDGDVLSTARDGRVSLTTQAGVTRLAGRIPVYNHDEDGMQGVAIDPDFEQNRWVYLYYAPPLDTPAGDAPETGTAADFERFAGHNKLSRFKLTEAGTLDLATEQEILRVPADRGICCHAGGEIDFDAQGNLYLSTGDDTNPFQSDGYTPIDERPNRNPSFDAQRASANTNDLRGKLLRIQVNADGTYTAPEGNLFPEAQDAQDKTRPEIYAMGFRNPFRFAVDKETGWVYLGDYGPDAGSANPNRGPGGAVEFNLIKDAGNYGWPYCHGDNAAYNDFDFATRTSGAKFDCNAPVNDSPRNTGLRQLPPSELPWITYDGGSVPEFGSGSESPMGGPVYRYDPELQSEVKFPEYFDGKNFAYEWGRGWIKTIDVGPNGERGQIAPFFDSMNLFAPMNIEFGPDGSLYVLDYGTGFFFGDENSAIYKINYVKGSRAPIAVAKATPDSGPAPLTVSFSSEGSRDPDGDPITYEWDFDGDGTVDSTEPNPTHTYQENGTYNALLKVTDSSGKSSPNSQVVVNVGNTRPEIEIEIPKNGDFFDYGDTVPYRVTGTDAEDGPIDCSRVEVDTALGHNDHSHGDQGFTGCEGSFTVPQAWEPPDQYSFYVVSASYTDNGGAGGAGPITATAQNILQHKTLQAEHYTAHNGTQTVDDANARGGKRVGYIDNGDWISYKPTNLSNMDSVTVRASSGGSGGNIELRWNAPDGPVLATVNVPNTGDWTNYRTLDPVPLQNAPEETGTLYLEFSGGFDVDEITFNGDGAAVPGRPAVSATATPTRGEAPLQVSFDGTASDPEGEQLTYEWDFGVPGTDEDKADTLDATYTYQQPGRYTATLKATDPGGLSRTASVAVNVFAASPPCEGTRSDEFEGANLDKNRWSAIVRENAAGYRLQDGALVLPTVRSDLYGGQNGAPNLILQPAPSGPWTVTTRMEFDPRANYQKAGLLLYGDDDNWLNAALVHAGSKRFEFIRETNGSPRNDGEANDQKVVPADFPSTYWVRMTSDGTNVTAAYSANNVDWTPFGRPAALAGIENPRIGLFALRSETDAPEIEARFDNFRFTGPDDEFEGTGLDRCRWTKVVREDAEFYSVGGGSLNIKTTQTDMYGANTTGKNLVLQPAPNGGWQATTKVDVDLQTHYQQAGIMLYGDDQNFLKFAFLKIPDGRKFEFIRQTNGTPRNEDGDSTANLPDDFPDTVYLRMVSDGTNLTGAYSTDGQSWTPVGRPAPLAGINDPHVGLYALGGPPEFVEARFDWFRLGTEIPLQAEATATPTSGQAPLKVDFTGSASGGSNVSYAWDFGVPGTDEDRATTKDASYTYQQPGTYTATLTVTDAGGKTDTDQVEIRVGQPCASPFQPEAGYRMLFDGTSQSLRDWKMSGPGGFEHEGCSIKSFGGLGLYWFTNGGREFRAPYSLKLEWMKPGDDNSGVFVGFSDPGNDPFNAVREGEEIQIDSTDNPAQTTGAIYLEQAPDAAARDAALRPDGEWNEYEIRVEADKILVFLNGAKINEWTDDDPNVDLTTGFIGVQNHGSSGPGNPDDVSFRNIRIKEEGAPQCGPLSTPDDQFDGTALDRCRWDAIVAEDPTKYAVADGRLTLTTTPGEIYQSDNRKSNLILQSASHAPEDYVLETEIDASRLDGGYSQGGIMVYEDDNNYVKFGVISDDGSTRPNRIELRSEVNGQVASGQPELTNLTAEQAAAPIRLRLTKAGNNYTGEASFDDGATWQPLASAVTNPITSPRFGLYAHGVLQEGDTVSFDSFTVDGDDPLPDTTAPTASHRIDGPRNPQGDYTGTVTVTLSAEDEAGGSGLQGIEYRLDGGPWTAYAAPIRVSERGSHTVAYRATDKAGNTSAEQAVSFRIVAPGNPPPPPDRRPPTVVRVSPAEGARNVPRGTDVKVTFSEAMRAASINRSSFELVERGERRPVAARVTYSPSKKQAVLDPARRLEAGKTYVVTVEGGRRGVEDLAGNAMRRDEVWRFTTKR